MEVTKTRKTTIKAFSAGKSKSGSSRKEPFSEASQRKHQQKERVAGRQILLTRGSNYQNNKQRWQQQNSNSNRGGKYQHSNQRGGRYGEFEQKSSPQDCLGGFTSSGGRPQARTSHSKKRLFYKKVLPNLPLTGRLKHFHKNWELITRYPDMLTLIKGFKMSKAQRELVRTEIETMLRKGVISEIDHAQGGL